MLLLEMLRHLLLFLFTHIILTVHLTNPYIILWTGIQITTQKQSCDKSKNLSAPFIYILG